MTKVQQVISEATPVSIGIVITLVAVVAWVVSLRGDVNAQDARLFKVEDKASRYEDTVGEIREDLGEIRGALGIPRKKR